MPYRLDNRHCDGAAKNNDEKQITVGQRKATTKAREQGKRDQLPQAWRHIHTASDLNCVNELAPAPRAATQPRCREA
jgi:hypothetical protein